MIEYLEDKDFNEEIKEGLVLVDFYANWCGPCKMLGMVLEEVIKENKIKILKVDVDKREDLSSKFRIMSIPYVVLFKDGKEVKHHVGFMNKDEVIKFINEE